MSRRSAARLAWSIWGLVAILAALSLLLLVLSAGDVDQGEGDWFFLVVFVTEALVFGAMGALIASRRPDNAIGWLFCGVAVSWALVGFTAGHADYAVEAEPGALPGGAVSAWVADWIGLPGLALAGFYLPLLFPDGRLPSRRWRPLAWLGAAVVACSLVAIALTPGPISGYPSVTNPVGLPWGGGVLERVDDQTSVLSVPLFLAAVAALVLRLRRSAGVERQQLKLFAFAAALIPIGFVASFATEGAVSDVFFGVGLVALAGLPIAAGIAILRHGLYDIDLVINRALVYGSLTAILAGAYIGLVLLLGLALGPLTSQSDQAIALSTLVVAALFQPVRRRVQALVDRRFYRHKYDAARTLERFGARLRSETDLDALRSALTGVVRETMQPAHVSLWLREGAR